jgi:hypothetical protein
LNCQTRSLTTRFEPSPTIGLKLAEVRQSPTRNASGKRRLAAERDAARKVGVSF